MIVSIYYLLSLLIKSPPQHYSPPARQHIFLLNVLVSELHRIRLKHYKIDVFTFQMNGQFR